MTVDKKKFETVQKQAQRAQRDSDKAEAELDVLMKNLKRDFDVDDLEEAQTLLAEMERDEKKFEKQYNVKLAKYEKKWSERLA